MTAHNVGALVVLKSGDINQLAGIVTERGKLRSAVDISIDYYCISELGC